MGVPDWVQVKKIYYSRQKSSILTLFLPFLSYQNSTNIRGYYDTPIH